MFVSLCFAVAGWLGCPPCGVPASPAVEIAPMPRPMPTIGLPTPVGETREVRPWRPRVDR